MIGTPRQAAGAAVLIASAQYFVAETIAAAAYHSPAYSFTRNYISDLGVAACRASGSCSPLAWLMNAAFILAGGLAIAAALCLAPLAVRPGWRWTVLTLAISHGLGSVLVGLVQSAPGTAAGTPGLHILGAYAAVLGGNSALVAVGLALWHDRSKRPFCLFSIAMGIGGLASAGALVGTHRLPPGLLERGAVDPITIWKIVTGVVLAVALLCRVPRRALA